MVGVFILSAPLHTWDEIIMTAVNMQLICSATARQCHSCYLHSVTFL